MRQFVELDKALHERHSFDCGEVELNIFLQEYALRHRKAGISKTMVLPVDGKEAPVPVCSYYTLSHTEIKRQALPERMAKKLPHYPIPVMLLAKLAIHKEYQGKRWGEVTLIAALKDALAINEYLPSYAIVVDFLAPEVQGFYEQYGFRELDKHNGRGRMYLPMRAVMQLKI